jgi:putative transposase
MFYSPIDSTLSQIIKDLWFQNGLEIIPLEVMPDHVHLFNFAKPTDEPSRMMSVIRGASPYKHFREYPVIKSKLWGGHLWHPSYYVGTAGQMSSETIKNI